MTNPNTDPLLREADELLAKITPGEWEARVRSSAALRIGDELYPPHVAAVRDLDEGRRCKRYIAMCDGEGNREADAKFIAAAPRLLRALRDRLVALEGELDAATRSSTAWQHRAEGYWQRAEAAEARARTVPNPDGSVDDFLGWLRVNQNALRAHILSHINAAEGRQGLVDSLSLTLDEARLLCHLLGRALTPCPTED